MEIIIKAAILFIILTILVILLIQFRRINKEHKKLLKDIEDADQDLKNWLHNKKESLFS